MLGLSLLPGLLERAALAAAGGGDRGGEASRLEQLCQPVDETGDAAAVALDHQHAQPARVDPGHRVEGPTGPGEHARDGA